MKLRRQIENFITAFIKDYSKTHAIQTAFESPIVGFADANSEYFKIIKGITNDKHAVPVLLSTFASFLLVIVI